MTPTPTPTLSPPVPVRVSPFVVASDSTLRLLLLAGVTIASTVYAWEYVDAVLQGPQMLAGYRACAGRQGDDWAACVAQHVSRPLGSSLGLAILAVLGVLVLAILAGPVIARRAQRLARPPEVVATAFDADLVVPARALGIEPPTVLLGRSPEAVARVTGARPGRARLVLGAGMLVLRSADRPAYDAVLGHELAHVRNRDVQLRELVVAAWWALLLVVVLPDTVATLVSGHVVEALPSLIRLLLVLLGARVIRNDVLRDRELSADVRAGQVPGLLGPLQDVVGRPTARRRWWWSSHPTPKVRLAALADPGTMLRLSWIDLALVAGTGYYLAPALRFWLQQLTAGSVRSLDLITGVSWVVGGAIGLGVWTAVVRDRLSRHGRPQRSLGRLTAGAGALVLGTFVGAAVIPLPGSSLGQRRPAVWVVLVVAAAVAALVLVMVSGALARRLARRLASRRRFTLAFWVGALATVAVSAALFDFGQWLLLYTSQPEVGVVLALGMSVLASVVQHAGWLALLAVAAALVLVVVTRPVSQEPTWILLPAAEPFETAALP